MDQAVPSKERFSVYQAITDKIIAAVEAGVGEFVMPWHRSGPVIGRPTNAATKHVYKGVNVVALWAEAMLSGYASGHWASFRQWQKLGASVRKGQHGATIVFYRELVAEAADDADDGDRRFVARASRVFNADQVDGWLPEPVAARSAVELSAQAEYFVAGTGAQIQHGGQVACYRPHEDRIDMPERRRFCGTNSSTPTESYYAVLLHELTHWTGAPHRLARPLTGRFGDDSHAKEELVAELGSAFLCADLGIANEPRLDHAAYVQSWLAILRKDARAIFAAAKDATRAAAFLTEPKTL